ncbi:MAG: hypothetical protein ACLUSL_09890 [Ruminococcus sp.]
MMSTTLACASSVYARTSVIPAALRLLAAWTFLTRDAADQYLTQRVQQALEQSGKTARSPLQYRSVSFAGVLKENKLLVRPMSEISDYQHVVEVTAVTLDTYNHLAGAFRDLPERGDALRAVVSPLPAISSRSSPI